MKFGLKTLIAATVITALTGCNSNNASNNTVERSSNVISAAQNTERSEANRARDQYRNPVETLTFFGLQDDMTVVEIAPGGGWYSEILAPTLKGQGTLYAAHFPADSEGYFKRSLDGFKDKIANDARFSEVKITEFAPVTHLDIAPASSADMVLTFRNVHNWYMRGEHQGVLSAFKAFNKALKPGGILGVVEHRLPEDHDDADQKRSGYMKQSYVIEVAKQAGFELVAQSDINANPKDTADHPKGVWTLPPRLALGEEQADKYKAIGESDRMTLKFKKL